MGWCQLPKFKIDIADIVYGYPNAQPVFADEKRREKDYIYVTGANIFIAEGKAQEIFDKDPKKYRKILKDTTSSVRKKGRY